MKHLERKPCCIARNPPRAAATTFVRPGAHGTSSGRNQDLLASSRRVGEDAAVADMTLAIHGTCDPRFAAVRDAFAANFEAGKEVGASFAATVDGKFVVDLWAGHADAAGTRPWEHDTIVNVFSTTKAMTALCAHLLVERGLLDLDAPVARYWPEFAQAGKDTLPVRYLLSHTAGLAAIRRPLPAAAFCDWGLMVEALAAETPWWEPGSANGYHALTFGYLVGEVVRRISGTTLGTFFRDEISRPLGADFHIGLPATEQARVADMVPPTAAETAAAGAAAAVDPESLLGKAMRNPPLTPDVANTRAWRSAEIPAANGHGNARSVARAMAALACGGTLDGVRLLGATTLARAIEEQCYRKDLVLGFPIRWGLGFMLASPDLPLGPNPRIFGHGGWGGSLGVADLDAHLSWAYVMNKMSPGTTGDMRAAGPLMALYAAL
jgi:CubicO group peptidase (beta-lactamase class C family)